MARVEVIGTVSSVWADSFTGADGDEVEYYRALVSVAGEAPMQLSVARDDYEKLAGCIGVTGNCVLDISANPGRRTRVYLKEVE